MKTSVALRTTNRTSPHIFRAVGFGSHTEDRLLVSAQSHLDRSVRQYFQYGFWKVSVIRSTTNRVPGVISSQGRACLLVSRCCSGAVGASLSGSASWKFRIHHRLCGIRRRCTLQFLWARHFL